MLEWRFVSEERLSLDPTTAEISLSLVGLEVGDGTAGEAAGLEEMASETTGLAEG
jgi:hypothetical protein